MGSLSISTHRGLVYWQVLLLAVSLLTFWCLPTSAQIVVVSRNAAEGNDVLLSIHNQPPNTARVVWYKGQVIEQSYVIAMLTNSTKRVFRGPTDGPVTINYDGSLLLKNVTIKDTGIYTVLVRLRDSETLTGCGQLRVYKPVRVPTILANNTTATENEDAFVLTCDTDEVSIQWFFNGRKLYLTERMTLSQDHSSLTIDPVNREDAGYYQCEVSNPISFVKSALFELRVKLSDPLFRFYITNL